MRGRAGYVAASLAIFLVAATITSLFLINLCATIFQCGCQSLWAAAAAHCNIHNPTGRHCPWCSFGETGYYLIYGVMIGAQGVTSFLPPGWGWPRRLVSSVLAFPLVGAIEAVVLGWATGYWN